MGKALMRAIRLINFMLILIFMVYLNVSAQNDSARLCYAAVIKMDSRPELSTIPCTQRRDIRLSANDIKISCNAYERYSNCSADSFHKPEEDQHINTANARISNSVNEVVTTTPSSLYAESYETGTAYLTFDDGPSVNNTPAILNILKEFGIKATFFVNGYGKKEIYKKIADEGHIIGNHTYSHIYKTVYSSAAGFRNDTEKLSDYIEELTGKRPDIFRFPGGSNNSVSRKYGGSKIMKELCGVISNEMGYRYFDWNVSSKDATACSVKKDLIVQSTLNGAKNKKHVIVLMHDTASKVTTVEALPEIITGLAEQGFKFDVLTQDTQSIQFIKP